MDVIESLKLNIQKAFLALGVEVSLNDIIIEHSRDTAHGDYATNAAMKNCRLLSLPPRDVATKIVEHLDMSIIDKVEIAGPGFINFFMKNDSLQEVVKKVVEEPFEKIVLFRFKDQDEHSPDMYWITKKEADVSNVTKLGISKEDIILLI